MPRTTQSYEDLLASSLADEIITSADELARGQGGPADSKQPTSREELDIWGRTDPAVNYDAVLARLMQGGIPPEEAQQFRLVQLYPQLAQAFAQPKSPQHAETLARMAEYPFRHKTYEHLDPKDRVTYAERMDREYQRSLLAPSSDDRHDRLSIGKD
jgi:hypothetical protein